MLASPVRLCGRNDGQSNSRMMLTKLRGIKPAALVALAALGGIGLAGCGFHLEGAGTLPKPMARTFIDTSDHNSDFYTSLRDALRLRGAEIVAAPTEADAVLSIVTDDAGQRVLSVTAQNVPREYEVYYRVGFGLAAGGHTLIEPQALVATRVYAWNETEVLGKSEEEAILRQALAEDLARRVMRRIEARGTTGQLPAASSPGPSARGAGPPSAAPAGQPGVPPPAP